MAKQPKVRWNETVEGKPTRRMSLSDDPDAPLTDIRRVRNNDADARRDRNASWDAKKGRKPDAQRYAKGGSVSARADGVAKKGRTRGKFV